MTLKSLSFLLVVLLMVLLSVCGSLLGKRIFADAQEAGSQVCPTGQIKSHDELSWDQQNTADSARIHTGFSIPVYKRSEHRLALCKKKEITML